MVQAGDVELFVEEVGAGAPCLVMHGGFGLPRFCTATAAGQQCPPCATEPCSVLSTNNALAMWHRCVPMGRPICLRREPRPCGTTSTSSSRTCTRLEPLPTSRLEAVSSRSASSTHLA